MTDASNNSLRSMFIGLLILGTTLSCVAEKIGSGKYSDNCVLYLRHDRQVDLPAKNLTSWSSKMSIRNADSPKKGRVAIIQIPSGSFRDNGHVALVTDVDKDGKKKSITIEEANYPSPGYWRRKVEGADIASIERKLNIKGYYKP